MQCFRGCILHPASASPRYRHVFKIFASTTDSQMRLQGEPFPLRGLGPILQCLFCAARRVEGRHHVPTNTSREGSRGPRGSARICNMSRCRGVPGVMTWAAPPPDASRAGDPGIADGDSGDSGTAGPGHSGGLWRLAAGNHQDSCQRILMRSRRALPCKDGR